MANKVGHATFSVCPDSIQITNQPYFNMPGVPAIGSIWIRKPASSIAGVNNKVVVSGDADFVSTSEPGIAFMRVVDGLILCYTLSEFLCLFEPISVSKSRQMNSCV